MDEWGVTEKGEQKYALYNTYLKKKKKKKKKKCLIRPMVRNKHLTMYVIYNENHRSRDSLSPALIAIEGATLVTWQLKQWRQYFTQQPVL